MNKTTTAQLDASATRFLAYRAFKDGAIDDLTLDFLDENPERADEVLDFSQWLSS